MEYKKLRKTYEDSTQGHTLHVDYTYYIDYNEVEPSCAYVNGEEIPMSFYWQFVHDSIEAFLVDDAVEYLN